MGRRTAIVGARCTVVLLAVALGACSGSSSPSPASTTAAASGQPTRTGKVLRETDVNGNYRQGIARSGSGWIFTTNNAIYRTDRGFVELEAKRLAIPPSLSRQGYDHLGDPDVHDGMIWVPVERDDKTQARQVTARYDEDTLKYVDSFAVPQHHNSFVAVDRKGVVYSTDQFTDDTIRRYRRKGRRLVPIEPLVMDQTIAKIQGGDVANGALWISTDDALNGLYRVDLDTGEVQIITSSGHVEGEGEGIDATPLRGALLHALVADERIAPMWVVDVAVRRT